MNAQKARILAVDDTKENLELLENILSDIYEFSAVTSGIKALTFLEKRPPDLILLDVMMPNMDGYETLQRMRESGKLGDIPVIFLTANKDRENEQKGLDLGAADYIGKPFNNELVKLRIKNQLEFKRHRDDLHKMVLEKTVDLRNTLKVMLTSLGSLAEFRDPETGGHIKRTQFIVQKLAETLKLNPSFEQSIPNDEYVDFYATAAPLHDIGKVGIKDEILRKPGRLTDEEFKTMQYHPQMGYDVLIGATKELHDNPLVKIAAEIALGHHERFDGNGYPNKLKGSEIPVGARLMSVADVYDALVSRRPYKEPLPHEVAVQEIVKGKGSQFDPDVVDAFLKIEKSLPSIYDSFKDEIT